MSISRNKIPVFSILLLVLQISVAFPLFADPFTAGDSKDLRPQASRAPSVILPDRYNKFQLEVREKSAGFLDDFRNNPSLAAVGLFFLVVFFYGILHGAGPGHRKTIVFTLFLARPAKKWEPLAAGFLSAGLHAGSSLVLFIFFNLIWQSVSTFSDSENIAFYLEGWTFITLASGALILAIIKIIELIRGFTHDHTRGEAKNIYLLLIVSSMFPCPGATMLLILALSQNLIAMGVLGVLAMSFGMGIIISIAGYLGMAGRDGIFIWFRNRKAVIQQMNNIFELFSYSVVVIFSLWMGSPFFMWLIRGN